MHLTRDSCLYPPALLHTRDIIITTTVDHHYLKNVNPIEYTMFRWVSKDTFLVDACTYASFMVASATLSLRQVAQNSVALGINARVIM